MRWLSQDTFSIHEYVQNLTKKYIIELPKSSNIESYPRRNSNEKLHVTMISTVSKEIALKS